MPMSWSLAVGIGLVLCPVVVQRVCGVRGLGQWGLLGIAGLGLGQGGLRGTSAGFLWGVVGLLWVICGPLSGGRMLWHVVGGSSCDAGVLGVWAALFWVQILISRTPL